MPTAAERIATMANELNNSQGPIDVNVVSLHHTRTFGNAIIRETRVCMRAMSQDSQTSQHSQVNFEAHPQGVIVDTPQQSESRPETTSPSSPRSPTSTPPTSPGIASSTFIPPESDVSPEAMAGVGVLILTRLGGTGTPEANESDINRNYDIAYTEVRNTADQVVEDCSITVRPKPEERNPKKRKLAMAHSTEPLADAMNALDELKEHPEMNSATYHTMANALSTEMKLRREEMYSQEQVDQMVNALSSVFVVQQAELRIQKNRFSLLKEYLLKNVDVDANSADLQDATSTEKARIMSLGDHAAGSPRLKADLLKEAMYSAFQFASSAETIY